MSLLDFPVSVGPFTTQSCRIASALNAFYRQHQFPRPNPESAENSYAGLDPGSAGLGHGEPLYCQLSPLYEITLTVELKEAANIPREAKFFAWAYPVVDDGRGLAGSSAEHMFLTHGGYTYFSPDRAVVGTTCIVPAELGTPGLTFGRCQVLPQRAASMLMRDGRFQDITLADLAAKGATHFAWIRPGEFAEDVASQDGCFAYRFGDQQTPKYFPVVNSPVFTRELLEEELEDGEAWVVLQTRRARVEELLIFDKAKSFEENVAAKASALIPAAGSVCRSASSGSAPNPISYAEWQASAVPGTFQDPWILTVQTP